MIRVCRLVVSVCLWVCVLVSASAAQTVDVGPPSPERSSPILLPVSVQVVDAQGAPRVGPLAIRLALYVGDADEVAVWTEDQVVTVDAAGRFSVQMGSATVGGIPAAAFVASRARWIGVTVVGEKELPRAPIVMTPYAARALEAEALGGAPADAYVRTNEVVARVMAALQQLKKEEGSGGGAALSSFASTTLGALAKFLDTEGTVGDSVLVETGGRVGLGTATPGTWWQVHGPGGGPTTHGLSPQGISRIVSHDGVSLEQGALAAGPWSTWLQSIDSGGGTARPLGLNPSGGNVGIGTVAPLSRLHVERGVRSGVFLGQAGDTASGLDYAAFLGFNMFTDGGAVFTKQGDRGGSLLQTISASAGASAVTLGLYSPTLTNEGFIKIINGKVGIGTADPTAALDVAGTGHVGGTLTVTGATTLAGGVTGNLNATGNITANGTIAAKYQDVAEWVEAVEALPPGTVVAADPSSLNKVRKSQRAYDTAVLGVVSAQPGVLLGEAGDGKVAVTQSGRVLVKVDARYGRIRPGDLLVASPTPGVAMRSRPGSTGGAHRPGTIIGKALQGLATGTGEILVLITLQ